MSPGEASGRHKGEHVACIARSPAPISIAVAHMQLSPVVDIGDSHKLTKLVKSV